MTYSRFKEIWCQTMSKYPITNFKIISEGCHPHTIKALINASNEDFSDFEKAEYYLKDYDDHFSPNYINDSWGDQ